MDFDDMDEAEAQAGAKEEAAKPELPPLDRKMRVLGIHGQGSNSNIMKWQTDKLRKLMKDEEQCEWDFVDGIELWDWEGGGNNYTDPSTEADSRHAHEHPIMIGMAQGQPFLGWYQVEAKDHSSAHWVVKLKDSAKTFTASPQLELSCELILDHIKKNGPYDCVVAFSSGTYVLNVLTLLLRERDESIPWRLSVLFSPVLVRDDRFQRMLEKPINHPVIMVWGNCGEGGLKTNFATDDWSNHYAKKQVSQWYFKNLVVLEDGDHGHEIPRVGHNQERTCMKIAAHMFKLCGQKPPFPTKVTKLLSGGETVEEEL